MLRLILPRRSRVTLARIWGHQALPLPPLTIVMTNRLLSAQAVLMLRTLTSQVAPPLSLAGRGGQRQIYRGTRDAAGKPTGEESCLRKEES